ncbi:MAG: phage portal protein [Clostridia bacterium]|nr:phage portal protein [Clostridia bacterium]MBR4889794.1 phage portal protein [Clostridia bacterium]
MMIDTSKPNNKIANSYASYITDTLVGYFLGKPVVYSSANENAL